MIQIIKSDLQFINEILFLQKIKIGLHLSTNLVTNYHCYFEDEPLYT